MKQPVEKTAKMRVKASNPLKAPSTYYQLIYEQLCMLAHHRSLIDLAMMLQVYREYPNNGSLCSGSAEEHSVPENTEEKL